MRVGNLYQPLEAHRGQVPVITLPLHTSGHWKEFQSPLQTPNETLPTGMHCAAATQSHHHSILEQSFVFMQESNKWERVTMARNKFPPQRGCFQFCSCQMLKITENIMYFVKKSTKSMCCYLKKNEHPNHEREKKFN